MDAAARAARAASPDAARAADQFRLPGGFGVYPIELGATSHNWAIQSGYNQSTTLVPTFNNGLTFTGTLANPFPGGIAAATGNPLGGATFVGQSVSYYNPDTRTPYSMRWSMNVQRLLPGQVLLEAGYVGNKSLKLLTSRAMNALSNKYLSKLPTRDQTTIDHLQRAVRPACRPRPRSASATPS
jgi:hypothetical protein